MLKRLLKLFVAVVFLIIVCCVMYTGYLVGVVDQRFTGRKWQIPSTIYSDSTLLFPGKKINPEQLKDKLSRTGYAPYKGRDFSRGMYRIAGKTIELYLKDLVLPWNTAAGFKVFLELNDDHVITRMFREDMSGNPEQVEVLEIGPEKLMQFFGTQREDRTLVAFKNIPENLVNAVIAAEDNRFFRHFGIDPKGILRAFVTNVRYGEVKQGGSTLTQQLAKNYFLTHERTLSRKLKEVFLSIAIEARYSKNEILEIYLNEIYFGQKGSVSVNGVGEAALFYFGKKVSALSLSECAVMAGMIKGPNLYSPYANMERCIQRRNSVLGIMLAKEMISNKAFDLAVEDTLETRGFQGYSRKAPYFIDYVSGQLKELYPSGVLTSMGYSVYTTIDMDVQIAAEKALARGLTNLERKKPELKKDEPEKKLQGAVLVLQPRTGNILAMVGGRDYNESQFNRISQARRQPGSCFKPIVTATLLDTFTPSDLLANEEISYIIDGTMWTPDNYSDNKAHNNISVRDMLRTSCNRAAVDLVIRGGIDKVVEGVKQFRFSGDFRPLPSIALGSFEVTPLDLARAYCVFAADGVEPYPLSLKDVVDEKGTVLLRKHMDIEQVLSPSKAFLMTSMLSSVVKGGTAKGLSRYGIEFEVAAKTGTTSNYRDAWFIGYTPDFLALVWIGFDNGDSVLSTGSGAALPVWADLVLNMPGYLTESRFPVPPGIVSKKICKQSGEPAIKFKCPEIYEEFFLEENVPENQCHIHSEKSFMHKFLFKIKGLFNED